MGTGPKIHSRLQNAEDIYKVYYVIRLFPRVVTWLVTIIFTPQLLTNSNDKAWVWSFCLSVWNSSPSCTSCRWPWTFRPARVPPKGLSSFLCPYEPKQIEPPINTKHFNTLSVQLQQWCRYRIYSNKYRGAYLIFRATSAALIRGQRLFKHCTRQIYIFYILIQRHTFYLLLFLWTDTKLIANLELRRNSRGENTWEFHDKQSENISGESTGGAALIRERPLLTFLSQMRRLFKAGA